VQRRLARFWPWERDWASASRASISFLTRTSRREVTDHLQTPTIAMIDPMSLASGRRSMSLSVCRAGRSSVLSSQPDMILPNRPSGLRDLPSRRVCWPDLILITGIETVRAWPSPLPLSLKLCALMRTKRNEMIDVEIRIASTAIVGYELKPFRPPEPPRTSTGA
jgi:hypothetical protein